MGGRSRRLLASVLPVVVLLLLAAPGPAAGRKGGKPKKPAPQAAAVPADDGKPKPPDPSRIQASLAPSQADPAAAAAAGTTPAYQRRAGMEARHGIPAAPPPPLVINTSDPVQVKRAEWGIEIPVVKAEFLEEDEVKLPKRGTIDVDPPEADPTPEIGTEAFWAKIRKRRGQKVTGLDLVGRSGAGVAGLFNTEPDAEAEFEIKERIGQQKEQDDALRMAEIEAAVEQPACGAAHAEDERDPPPVERQVRKGKRTVTVTQKPGPRAVGSTCSHTRLLAPVGGMDAMPDTLGGFLLAFQQLLALGCASGRTVVLPPVPGQTIFRGANGKGLGKNPVEMRLRDILVMSRLVDAGYCWIDDDNGAWAKAKGDVDAGRVPSVAYRRGTPIARVRHLLTNQSAVDKAPVVAVDMRTAEGACLPPQEYINFWSHIEPHEVVRSEVAVGAHHHLGVGLRNKHHGMHVVTHGNFWRGTEAYAAVVLERDPKACVEKTMHYVMATNGTAVGHAAMCQMNGELLGKILTATLGGGKPTKKGQPPAAVWPGRVLGTPHDRAATMQERDQGLENTAHVVPLDWSHEDEEIRRGKMKGNFINGFNYVCNARGNDAKGWKAPGTNPYAETYKEMGCAHVPRLMQGLHRFEPKWLHVGAELFALAGARVLVGSSLNPQLVAAGNLRAAHHGWTGRGHKGGTLFHPIVSWPPLPGDGTVDYWECEKTAPWCGPVNQARC